MTSASTFASGTMLARYTIGEVIGRGATSVVYVAYDPQLDRHLALKVMAPPLADDGGFRSRFLRESRLAASLDHPNVLPVYDAGEADGHLFIAMRLVRGTDLRRVLRREGPLEPQRALAIVAQVADALDAAHVRGLLHRDVKPANILLAADDEVDEHVYLSDFGLAMPGAGAKGSELRGFQGTAEYAAPEQIEGQPEPRSDVYGLACVLFECIAGDPPFGRGRLLETLWRHLNSDPPKLADQPESVNAFFATALAKAPERRPATSGELVSLARTAFGLDRHARFRARLIAAVIAVTVAASVGAAAVVLRERNSPQGNTGPTVVTFAGTSEEGSSGDGGQAARARLSEPFALAVDRAGDVYVSEAVGGRVRRIDRKGIITTVAGVGEAVAVNRPWDPARPNLAVDAAGRLYILRINKPIVRRLDRSGVITTFAGTGASGYLAAGPRTVSADLCSQPSSPAVDPKGRVYIVCLVANRVIRIDRRGIYTTVAGTGAAGYSGDNGPATKATLNGPTGIAIDRHGNLFIADFLNNRVRKVDRRGVITTFAGNGLTGLSGDGWPATSVELWQPIAVAVDAADDVYVVEAATSRVRKVDPSGVMTTIAGTGRSAGGGLAGSDDLQDPTDVAVDARGDVFIADRGNNRIREVVP